MYATATTTGANVIGNGPWNHSDVQYFGGSIKLGRFRFCSGGSGYVLNRVALKLLVEELFETQACWPHHTASDEDRIIARCFGPIGGLNCSNTNDERNQTR
uniref:Hexosyltransferase n=1 Tax=Grammatophora oceanica TaxID=210454 RepID=A0A7S1VX39_9STRA|mmetsp:Transcript_8754/g.12816  ORF Transcript_8754/g.12816 Transcript_8754/m.12816 type:complete len:101 (+) Transcript_8754:2-304(+)